MNLDLWLSLAAWIGITGITVLGTFWTRKHLSAVPPHLDAPFALYPVSILKPLKGADEGLERNLETFFELDFPEFELLFSVADASDPAVPVVQSLMRRYPDAIAKLLIGTPEGAALPGEIGINPKVNNLARSYEAARHDWILISDSNVRVEPDYLRRQVAHLETGVGMVTSVVAGLGARGLGGHLEAAYLNTFYARWMVIAEKFGRPCVIGKSMLFRRSVAKRFGGIQTLSRYLAEDYMAGEAMRALGLKVLIAVDPIDQHIGRNSFRAFWSRHIRWGRIRKSQEPLAFLTEPFLGAIPCGLLGAWAMSGFFGISFAMVLAIHLSLWSACDLLLMRRLGKSLTPTLAWSWFLRELLALPLWLHILSGNTVNWRGRKLAIRRGGLLEPS